MDIQRRTFLQVVGASLVAPTLFVKEDDIILPSKLQSREAVPTGLDWLDISLDGGIRPGLTYIQSKYETIHEQALLKTLALNMSKYGSVGFVTDKYSAELPNNNQDYDPRNFCLYNRPSGIDPLRRPRWSGRQRRHGVYPNILKLAEKHDVVVAEGLLDDLKTSHAHLDDNFHTMQRVTHDLRAITYLCYTHNCRLIFSGRHRRHQPLATVEYSSSYVLKIYPNFVGGLTYRLSISKNRYGRQHNIQEMFITDRRTLTTAQANFESKYTQYLPELMG